MPIAPAEPRALSPTRILAAEAKTPSKFVFSKRSRTQSIPVSKRAFDIVLATLALAILSPLLVIVAIIISLETKGAPIFRQQRWGKDYTKINIFKFRTMYARSCDASGRIQTKTNDPRVTRFGKFLRKNNIDELPQLINILRGDMSFVGPRCHPIGMLAAGQLYENLVPSYHSRHKTVPGLTGLAQLNGYRGPTTNKERAIKRIAFDRLYLRKQSFTLDLKIIALTAFKELSGGTGC